MSKKKMKDIQCFVFDMDGTIYLGNELIDGTLELFSYFDDKSIPYFFLTNNSSKSSEEYLKKLHMLGLKNIKKDQIITSGDITINYLKNKYDKPKVFLVGTDELKNSFQRSGIEVTEDNNENINCVVVGFDTSVDYQKLSTATRYIRKGHEFIGTNMDLVCPIPGDEFIPDCGAICKLIEVSTNVKPKFIGKPSLETVKYLVKKVKVSKENIAIVGDRLYTDVATGVNNGMNGVAVLTGETNIEEIEKSQIRPTYIYKSIREIYECLL